MNEQQNNHSVPQHSWLKRVWGSFARSLAWAIKKAVVIVMIFAILIVAIDVATSYAVKDKIYSDINQLPTFENGLLLGTAKYYSKGVPNLYYKYRLETAAELMKKGKIKKLLVSGDNQTPYYNEPKVMTSDLRKMGIPAKDMEQDFAGYRTFDSVVRAEKVYKFSPFVIISQRFHCERALFIAKTHNIEAVCFEAKYPDGHIKVRLREIFARVGMLLDYVKGVTPETFEKRPSKEVPKEAKEKTQ